MHCSQIIPGFPYLEREKGTSCILKQVDLLLGAFFYLNNDTIAEVKEWLQTTVNFRL